MFPKGSSSVAGIDFRFSDNHHEERQATSRPTAEPADPPTAEAGTDRGRDREAEEFRFESHGVSKVTCAFSWRQPGISAAVAADGRRESSSRAALAGDRAVPIRAIQVRLVPPGVRY